MTESETGKSIPPSELLITEHVCKKAPSMGKSKCTTFSTVEYSLDLHLLKRLWKEWD